MAGIRPFSISINCDIFLPGPLHLYQNINERYSMLFIHEMLSNTD